MNCYEMEESQSSCQINQGWIDTLGGVSRYKDPRDPYYEGTIPWSRIPSLSTRWGGAAAINLRSLQTPGLAPDMKKSLPRSNLDVCYWQL